MLLQYSYYPLQCKHCTEIKSTFTYKFNVSLFYKFTPNETINSNAIYLKVLGSSDKGFNFSTEILEVPEVPYPVGSRGTSWRYRPIHIHLGSAQKRRCARPLESKSEVGVACFQNYIYHQDNKANLLQCWRLAYSPAQLHKKWP